jgi:hypothetical protein
MPSAAGAEDHVGKVFGFGPEITFRAQPHGTFRFLFNAITLAGQAERSASVKRVQ